MQRVGREFELDLKSWIAEIQVDDDLKAPFGSLKEGERDGRTGNAPKPASCAAD